MEHLILTPAYGRDYSSKSEVLQDFYLNRDFIIQNFGHAYEGKPVNLQQLGRESITFRYNNMRSQFPWVADAEKPAAVEKKTRIRPPSIDTANRINSVFTQYANLKKAKGNSSPIAVTIDNVKALAYFAWSSGYQDTTFSEYAGSWLHRLERGNLYFQGFKLTEFIEE